MNFNLTFVYGDRYGSDFIVIHMNKFKGFLFYFFSKYFLLFIYLLFMAAPMAYGGSQARGWIGATAAGLRHSHSHTWSKPSVTYTKAHGNAGSLTHWARPGIEPGATSWFLVRFVSTVPQRELRTGFSKLQNCLCHSPTYSLLKLSFCF